MPADGRRHGQPWEKQQVRPSDEWDDCEPTSPLARRGKFYPISSAKLDGVQVRSSPDIHPPSDVVYTAATAVVGAALCAVAEARTCYGTPYQSNFAFNALSHSYNILFHCNTKLKYC